MSDVERPGTVRAGSGGSVRIVRAGGERRRLMGVARLAAVALAALLASAAVLIGARFVTGGGDDGPRPAPLDARALAAAPAGAPAGAVPGSTRLSLLGPLPLVDSRRSGRLRAGAQVSASLPALPPGSSAVLLEVSLVNAAGPGAVTVDAGAGRLRVLQLPRAKSQLTSTVVLPVAADGTLRVATEGGGHLVVNLLGAFEPAVTATAGRLLPVPASRVLRLVPRTDGKDATIRLAQVPALRGITPSAVVLQIAADVGRQGGFVATVPPAGARKQELFWMATGGADRTRVGLLVVPVTDGVVRLHYQAGSELTASLVGYVTDKTAPASTEGLVVPVRDGATQSARIGARAGQDVTVIPAGGIGGVPAERIGAVLLGITALGDAVGAVTVHAPGAPASPTPLVIAAKDAPRPALALTQTRDGAVRVQSESGASVRLTPQAVLLRA